jgi:hypothetical protein
MSKMLYFDGKSRYRVVADGESLLVKREGKDLQRYPIRYLTGLEVKGGGEWSLSALQLLLRRRIPIVFRERDGTLLGYAHAKTDGGRFLPDRLRDCLAVEGFLHEYAVWRSATERRLSLRVARHLRLGLEDLRRTPLLKRIQHLLVERYGVNANNRWAEAFLSAMEGESTRFLMSEGFDGRFLSAGTGHLQLAQDLAWMAFWREYAGLFAACRRCRQQVSGEWLAFLGEVRKQRETGRKERDEFWRFTLGQLTVWLGDYGL